jgi:predicted restriction endonuclease
LVRQNFGGRCAVSGKHLGGVLEAAHIEGADLGCYSVGNGILLSPTLHKLFDRHLMGVNPETLTVHFKGSAWKTESMVTPVLQHRF